MTHVAPRMLLDVADGVATITLNRPGSLNALNLALKEDLARTIAELSLRPDVRALLLTGAGRAFCAGGDITEMDAARNPRETRARLTKLLTELFIPLARLE